MENKLGNMGGLQKLKTPAITSDTLVVKNEKGILEC